MRTILSLLLTIVTLSLHAQNWIKVDSEVFEEHNNTNGVSFVDIDQDGDLDLFLSNAHTPFGFNTIYRNDGNDQFVKVEAGEVTGLQAITFGHTWGDFDNDGLPDLFIANGFTKMGSLLYKNLGNFQFRRVESYNVGNNSVLAFDAAWADYDNDGWLDLVTIHPARFVGKPINSNSLFKNNGDLTFAEIISTPITGPTAPFTNGTWSDYDLDGDMDLFIGSGPANGTVAPDFLYKNLLTESGKASFSRITNISFAVDAMDGQTWNWIDTDNDGDLDLFMTNYSGTPNPQGTPGGMLNNFYRNEGDTIIRITEGPLVNELSISLANMWADFDNDGFVDVIVGNSQSTNKHYRNKGDGTFEYVADSPIEAPGAKNTWGMTYGDYDNDGDIDIYISNKISYINGGSNGGDVNYLYRNDLNNGNRWLEIKCSGTDSNKSAIGTIIQVTATLKGKTMTQTRVIGTNNTFLGDNDIRAHFGLADAKTIQRIQIRWPSGQIEEYKNIDTNQLLAATEGEGIKQQLTSIEPTSTNDMKQRTKSTLILLLLTFSIAARAQTAVTTENISGEHFKPYANKWKMYAVDAEGKENLVTIWTDYAQLIELEGTTYISRVQELYNPGMHLRELWTNLFEYETLLPYRASQFKTSGDLTYTEFENGKINHASKPAAQEKSQTVYGTGSVYDWSMYGVLLSGLPFKKGEVYSIPVFSQQNDSGKGNIIATVQGQETVADDDSKNHLCWKIDTNTGLTFWVTKKAPYVIQLSYPTPAGGKMIWRMYQQALIQGKSYRY